MIGKISHGIKSAGHYVGPIISWDKVSRFYQVLKNPVFTFPCSRP